MTDDEQDRHVLLCPPVVFGVPPRVPAKGRRCDWCGRTVWVSELMLPEVDARRLEKVCHGCAEHHAEEGWQIGLHPRQRADVADHPERAQWLEESFTQWREVFDRRRGTQ